MSLLDLIKSPQAMERAEWAAVLHTMTRARTELCKDGVTHTWLDGAIGIAQERSEGKGTYAPPDVPEGEPDWSSSVTDGGKLWKTPSRPMAERLQLADEAIANRDGIIVNLQAQLAAQAAAPVLKPVAWVTKEALRHWDEHKADGPQEYTFLPRALNGWDLQDDLQVLLFAAH